jgi:hypothetical protein
MTLTQARELTREERVEAHLEAERLARRDSLRTLLIGAVLCFAWLAIGLYILGWSMHTTDAKLGSIFYWSGLVLGNAGILGTIAWVVKRAESRGDLGR